MGEKTAKTVSLIHSHVLRYNSKPNSNNLNGGRYWRTYRPHEANTIELMGIQLVGDAGADELLGLHTLFRDRNVGEIAAPVAHLRDMLIIQRNATKRIGHLVRGTLAKRETEGIISDTLLSRSQRCLARTLRFLNTSKKEGDETITCNVARAT